MASVVTYPYDLTIYEGGTYDKWFKWLAGAPPVQVSLLGYTGKFQIRKKTPDVSPLLSLLPISSNWVADGPSGIYMMDVGVDDKYRIYIRDEDTLGICPGHKNTIAVYDLFLYSPLGESVLKQYGTVTIIAAVTR